MARPSTRASVLTKSTATTRKVRLLASSAFASISRLTSLFIGCLDDIRLESKPLPLPPALNGTQWGQATTSHGVRRNCPSNNPCSNVICPLPFQCNDLWMDYECR